MVEILLGILVISLCLIIVAFILGIAGAMLITGYRMTINFLTQFV
jgi:hypothetical protein